MSLWQKATKNQEGGRVKSIFRAWTEPLTGFTENLKTYMEP